MTKILGATFVALGLGLVTSSRDAAARGFGLSVLASLGAGYILRTYDRLDAGCSGEGEIK